MASRRIIPRIDTTSRNLVRTIVVTGSAILNTLPLLFHLFWTSSQRYNLQ